MKSVFFLAFLVSVSLAANIERDEPIYEGYSINNDGGNDLATLIANSNNFLDILNNLIDQNGLLDNPGGDQGRSLPPLDIERMTSLVARPRQTAQTRWRKWDV